MTSIGHAFFLWSEENTFEGKRVLRFVRLQPNAP